jgi:putative inorganic carbon (hco3(-)) transporter
MVAIAGGLAVALATLAVLSFDSQSQALALAVPVGAVAGLVALKRFDLFVLGLLVVRPSLDALNVGGTTGGALDPAAGAGAVFVATGMLWVIAQWSSGVLVPLSLASKGLVVLCVAGVSSTLVSAEPIVTAEANVRLLAGVLMFVVLEQMMSQRPQMPLRLVGAVFASLLVPAVVAAGQAMSGEGITGLDGASRVFGTFAHPNPFGTYLVSVLLLAAAVAAGQRGRWRAVAVAVSAASGLLLLLTGARGAWIAAFLGLLYLGVRLSRGLLAALALTVVVAVALVPSTLTRVTDLTEERETGDSPSNSLAWRFEYWGEVVPMASSSPLNGLGLEMVQRSTDEGLQPHNVFVQTYAELGMFGLGALGVSIVGLARYLAVRRRSAITDWDRTLAAAAVAVMLGYAAQMPSENLLTQGIAWWFLAAAATYGSRPGVRGA